MANFRTVRGTKASALDGHELLYIHCVSKERFELVPYGFECVKIECCELHVSFLDSLDVRRIALCPSIVNGLKIEEAFAGCDSPTLIQMHSSCDFKFYYPKDSKQQQNLLGCVMLWKFDILPSPTSQPVPPHVPETSDEHLDDSLPPVNLELPASCNCYKKPLNPVCLVNIPVPVGLEEETLGNDSTSSGQVNNEIEEIQQLTQLLEVEKAIVNSGENVGEDPDDLSAGEEYDNDNTGNPLGRNVDLYPEKFVVVGSWQERRYQQALAICMWRKSCKKELLFKIEHEPDNVRDKNALKFLVFHNDNWHIIGYCGINKIPKLKSALHQKEVHSISLDSLKRTCAFREQKLLYSASLMIIKEGPWNKDDPMNKYNSNIIC